MDKKISDLTLVSSLTGDDVIPIVNGSSTKKVKVSQLNIPSISGLATTSYVDTQDNLKVDKVAGQGLSDQNFTSVEKTKLAGIQNGAEVNVNADWISIGGDSQILNKPTIPTQTSQLTNNGYNGEYPFITALDIENNIVNGVNDKAPSQNAVFDALALKENQLGTPVGNGYVLSSTLAGERVWVPQSGSGTVVDFEYLLTTSFRTLYNY
jgi:hypothetical protein